MDIFSFQWSLRTKLIFGVDEYKNLGRYVAEFGRRPLIVTGRSSLRKTGRLDEAVENLKENGLDAVVFEGVEENPRTSTVSKAAALAREEKCDVVLAIGGGSSMDAAKAIALELTTGESCWNYIVMRDDRKPVPRLTVPLVLVPTMNATGSEMNGNAVITNDDVREKNPLSDPNLAPDLSIIDPALTVTLPWRQTAYTLMDATAHALEPYLTAQSAVDVSFGVTEDVLKSVVEAGKVLRDNEADLGARSALAWAGSMACCNLPSLGLRGERYCHHIEHVLSAHTDIAHALGLAIIIPRWMRMFETEMKDTLLRVGSIYLNGKQPDTTTEVIDGFDTWLDSLGLRTSLREQGVIDEALAEKMAESLFNIGPLNKKFAGGRVPMTKEQLIELYRTCFNQ